MIFGREDAPELISPPSDLHHSVKSQPTHAVLLHFYETLNTSDFCADSTDLRIIS